MNYIFTITASGDRTNIMASFPIWNKEMFLKHVKEGKNYGRYRYGTIGGYMTLLKEMDLLEFDSVFSPEDFTAKEITELFRKEISLKYGEHAEKAKIKPIAKKDLERGCVYKDFSGQSYLYFGEVEKTTDKTYKKIYQSEKKPLEVERGYGFEWYYENKSFNARIDVLKSPKRLMEKVEGIKIDLKPKYVTHTSYGYYNKEEHEITLRLL